MTITGVLRLRFFLSFLLLLGLCLGLMTGCSGVQYLYQASKGQLALFNHRKPIPEVIKDPKTPPSVKALLSEIAPVKKFGEEHGLKPTANYEDYVKLDRGAAVYVVSACEPLRFRPKEWTFPIVGSFPYLGWFELDQAKGFAEDLKKEGLDVDLRGARAYSTLGWFRDAVLSTMLSKGPDGLGDLVNVILHESVHATLYIKGQSYFNESIASFVADHLTRDYLIREKGEKSVEVKSYEESLKENALIEQRLHEAYEKLDQLYVSSKSIVEKQAEKKRILTALQEQVHFRREINNATLIQYKTYSTGGEAFSVLLKKWGSDWRRFLNQLKTLGPSDFSKPQQEDFDSVILKLSGIINTHYVDTQ